MSLFKRIFFQEVGTVCKRKVKVLFECLASGTDEFKKHTLKMPHIGLCFRISREAECIFFGTEPLKLFFLSLFLCVKVRDAQQDSEPAVWSASGVLLPGLWHVSEALEQTGGGHGEAHQSH